MLYSTPNSLVKGTLKNTEERRKTLIIAATTGGILKYDKKIQDHDEINRIEEVGLIEEETQIEQRLLNCYRLSLLPNPMDCEKINEENNKVGGIQQDLSLHFVKEAAKIEKGSLDLYRVSPSCNEIRKDNIQNKEAKLLEDNIQGSTGLALLVGSDSITPRSSPKANTPRLNVEKSSIEHPKLMVPTTIVDIGEFNYIVETTKNDYRLQVEIESQNNSSTKTLLNTQFEYKVPVSKDLHKSFHKKNLVSETLDNTTSNATMSLTNKEVTIEKHMEPQYKSFDNLLFINEKNLARSIPSKTPRRNSKLHLEFQKQFQFHDGKGGQDSFGSLKNANSGLVLEPNERDCKEWFRKKLWCFLFEDLTRALDELYFLCNLEGASEKMDEAIFFLEEANQDFMKLKSCIGISRINEGKFDTIVNIKKFKTCANEGHFEMKSNERESKNQDDKKEAIKHDMKEFVKDNSTSQNLVETNQIQSNVHAFNIKKEPNVQFSGKKIATTFKTHINDKKHDTQGIKDKFEILSTVKALEVEIDERMLKIEANKKANIAIGKKERIGYLCDTQILIPSSEVKISTIPLDSPIHSKVQILVTPFETLNQIPITSANLIFGIDDKIKSNFQSLPCEIPKWPPCSKFQHESRDVDCKDGSSVNIAQSSFINQPQTIVQNFTIERKQDLEALINKKEGFEAFKDGRGGFQTFRDSRKKFDSIENLQDHSTSVIGYQVDEERQKMVKFVNNDTHKQKSNTKTSHNVFSGRLMRPTESSNIRVATNIKIKEEEKSKNKGSHESWSLTTKYHSDDLKQKGSWLDALATPRRGPSRFLNIDKVHDTKNMDLIKRKMLLKNSSNKTYGEEHQLVSKKLIKDTSKDPQEKLCIELPIKKVNKINYKLNQEKLNKSMICKTTIKNRVHEYDISHVEQRLAERLKQGADRRLACVEKIKSRVTLINEEDKHNKTSSYDNFWLTDFYKNNKIIGNVEDPHLCFTNITFFQKQAMKKKVINIQLKLANKKVEFLEPLVEIGAVGIGSATTIGLAKTKIGKWMEELCRIQLTKETTTTIAIVSKIAKCLDGKDFELHIARQLGLLDFVATSIPLRQDPTITLDLLQIQKTLLYLPANRSYFIIKNLLPPMVPMLLSSIEIFSAFGNFYQEPSSITSNQESICESNNDKIKKTEELDVLQEILEGLLNSTISIMGHYCIDDGQLSMQDDLANLLVASGLIHQLQIFFAVFNWQQNKQIQIPTSIILSLKLMEVLTGSKRKSFVGAHEEPINILIHKPCLKYPCKSNKKREDSVKEGILALTDMGIDCCRDIVIEKSKEDQHYLSKEIPRIVITQKPSSLTESITLLVAAILETRLVGLLSILIGILLQINPFLQKEANDVLPPNFNEVAILILQVLNNVARLDLSLIQNKLAMPDVCMEFYELTGFLLRYCTSNWKTSVDEIATLLLETMMLIGYAALLHPKNQAILRWGKGPTILQRMCNLPFAFFSDSKLTPILIGTILAVCYGSEINRDIVQQQLSMEILLTFLKSSKTSFFDSSHSSNTNKVKEEIKDLSEKTKRIFIKRFKNDDKLEFDSQRSTQQMFLPKSLFSPSAKGMLALKKLDLVLSSPSTPKNTKQGERIYCSTIQSPIATPPHAQCSRVRKSLEFFDGTSRSMHGVSNASVTRRNIISPKLSNRNFNNNDGSSNKIIEILPIAFALQNRFPEGLWNYAKDFFSSNIWMEQ